MTKGEPLKKSSYRCLFHYLRPSRLHVARELSQYETRGPHAQHRTRHVTVVIEDSHYEQAKGVNSMKRMLGAGIIIVVLGTSAVAAERIHLAQAGQTVAPPPVRPPSLDQTTTSCQI